MGALRGVAPVGPGGSGPSTRSPKRSSEVTSPSPSGRGSGGAKRPRLLLSASSHGFAPGPFPRSISRQRPLGQRRTSTYRESGGRIPRHGRCIIAATLGKKSLPGGQPGPDGIPLRPSRQLSRPLDPGRFGRPRRLQVPLRARQDPGSGRGQPRRPRLADAGSALGQQEARARGRAPQEAGELPGGRQAARGAGPAGGGRRGLSRGPRDLGGGVHVREDGPRRAGGGALPGGRRPQEGGSALHPGRQARPGRRALPREGQQPRSRAALRARQPVGNGRRAVREERLPAARRGGLGEGRQARSRPRRPTRSTSPRTSASPRASRSRRARPIPRARCRRAGPSSRRTSSSGRR